MYNTFIDFLEFNRSNIKEFHFLCFNNRPKDHRICIFAELKTNINFKNKYITTLGYKDSSFSLNINNFLKDDYKFSKYNLINFFENNCDTIDNIYDLNENINFFSFLKLNIDAHKKTFVNIITESQIIENCIFFTEKTFKAIIACQPFIIISTPFFLKKLKEEGYKTFDKWWDESYDEEIDFTRRFEKIIEIMIEISYWSLEKCYNVINEMEEILVYNFNRMMSDKDTFDFFNLLKK